MSVSRRVIHHGLYFAVLGPLIGVLFLVLYIFFAKEPLVLWVIIQVLPLFLLLSITTGAIPALLTGVMVACFCGKIGSQKRYRCLGWWHRWRRYHRDHIVQLLYILRAWLPRSCLKTFFLVTVSLSASFLHCWQVW